MYIQNKSPHAILDEKKLEEVFTIKKLYISHPRISRRPVYMNIPKEKRIKMESSCNKGIFVCYSESSKSYRI